MKYEMRGETIEHLICLVLAVGLIIVATAVIINGPHRSEGDNRDHCRNTTYIEVGDDWACIPKGDQP